MVSFSVRKAPVATGGAGLVEGLEALAFAAGLRAEALRLERAVDELLGVGMMGL
jgi:hypothetical protein